MHTHDHAIKYVMTDVETLSNDDALLSRFEARALGVLQRVEERLREYLSDVPGVEVGCADSDSPYASSHGDVGAYLVVTLPPGGEDSHLDVCVEVPYSLAYDGEHLGWGVGFASTFEGGCIGPGGMISNYTEAVWAANEDEVMARLDLLSREASEFATDLDDVIREHLR